ncbi:MAG: hypothetical protein ACJAZS_000812 [Alteromonas naphthalenivorans]|jgi:hypothetical protein
MFLSLIINELYSFAVLSLPFVVAYMYRPQFILSITGALLCSLLIGLRTAFVHYKQADNLAKNLKYSPTGECKDYFDEQIKEAGLNPDDIALRYAYCDSSIAMTVFNTVMVDQMIWKSIDKDPICIEAQSIIKTHIQPTLPAHTKQLHIKINDALTPKAQRFIFKHELGHVVDHYSWKKIALNGVIGFAAMYSGFYVAQVLIAAYDGLLVFGAAVSAASFVGLSLTWIGNALFKAPREKDADLFAAQYSSKEEVEAAADFFEKYEACSQEYRKAIGDTHSEIAPRFLMGYVSGQERVQYLRKIAASK